MNTPCALHINDPRWICGGDAGREALTADIQSVLAAVRKGVAGQTPAPAPNEPGQVWGEICVVLTNDARSAALNKTWRGKDAPTNVLSFPAAPQTEPMSERASEDSVLGDVVLAFETITREAAEQGKVFRNHVTHMVVHGVLHLLGYDHENDEEAGQMERLERRILADLEIADPYGHESVGKSDADTLR